MFKEVIALEESMSDGIRNVIIIGSGPAGYTAGLYTSRAMLEPLMFAGYMSGGQLMLTSDIENFPGYPEGIGGPEMMMQLREQAERFGLEVQDRNVERVDMSERPFKVYTEGEEFLTHSIIVSTGAESIWLGAEGEEEQKGRGISTCATCDGVNSAWLGATFHCPRGVGVYQVDRFLAFPYDWAALAEQSEKHERRMTDVPPITPYCPRKVQNLGETVA